jgi:hypothetical protein
MGHLVSAALRVVRLLRRHSRRRHLLLALRRRPHARVLPAQRLLRRAVRRAPLLGADDVTGIDQDFQDLLAENANLETEAEALAEALEMTRGFLGIAIPPGRLHGGSVSYHVDTALAAYRARHPKETP